MESRIETSTKPRLRDVAGAAFAVFKTALSAQHNPTHQFSDPQRSILHDSGPSPEVRTVNQFLDQKRIHLSPTQRELMQAQGHAQRQRRHTFFDRIEHIHNDLLLESRIAETFRAEEDHITEAYRHQIDASDERALEHCRRNRAFSIAGNIAHTVFGAVKTAVRAPHGGLEGNMLDEGTHVANILRENRKL